MGADCTKYVITRLKVTATASPREAQLLLDGSPELAPPYKSALVGYAKIFLLDDCSGRMDEQLPLSRVLSLLHRNSRNSLAMVPVGRPRDCATPPPARLRSRLAKPLSVRAAVPKRVQHGQQNVNRCLAPGRDPGGGITR